MEHKQRIFIYDRREMGVLILLGVMVAVFAFTLGVHLGKKARVREAGAGKDSPAVATVPDQSPNHQEIAEQAKGTQAAAESVLTDSLHEEVQKTGIHLDTPRQIDLPEKPRAENAGATTEPSAPKAEMETENAAPMTKMQPQTPVARPGHFSLQIGSFPTPEDAAARLKALDASGLNGTVREVDLPGKGKWYRVYLDGFPSKEEATKAGDKYRIEHKIDSFIVTKLSE
jgi:cell division protein FtsN